MNKEDERKMKERRRKKEVERKEGRIKVKGNLGLKQKGILRNRQFLTSLSWVLYRIYACLATAKVGLGGGCCLYKISMKSRDFIERRGRRFPVQHHRDMESILEGSWKRGQSSFPFPNKEKLSRKTKEKKKEKKMGKNQ